MDSYLARQPIFDINRDIYAYEILYRSGLENYFCQDTDSAAASSRVIFDAFQSFGLDNLTDQKPAFINFPVELLEEEIATLFPKELLVIEILEDVEITPEVIAECRKLKEMGYTIALDDFVYNTALEPLIDLADIIKVDFLATDKEQLVELKERLAKGDKTLLAEKVETWEDFRYAESLGFELFQGYFFSKPEILSTGKLTPLEISYFSLIGEVNKDRLDYDRLTKIIEGDVFLTYSLLKIVNSAYFGMRQEIASVKHALVILGEREIQKWVTLISMRGMNHTFEAPVSLSIIRAEFGRQLGKLTGLCSDEHDGLFLMGLFSLLDVLLQRPLASILEEVRVPECVSKALLAGKGPCSDIYHLILAYEQAEWDKINKYGAKLGLEARAITNAYLEAIKAHPNMSLVEDFS